MRQPPPVLLYHALGGGLGHAVRALALARQLRRRIGGRHLVVVNTPFAACLEEPGIEIERLAPGTTAQEASTHVIERIRDLQPALFVVDTFPRGVGGELVASLQGERCGPRLLIARGLPLAYVGGHDLEEFVRRHYDAIVVPGEPCPYGPAVEGVATAPFLIRDLDELPSRAEAIARLAAREPVVLVVGCGTLEECRAWSDEAGRLGDESVRLALPPGVAIDPPAGVRVIRHFPLMECLPGVRLVIGNAGYHLVHESRALGIPGRFLSRARKYDDQEARLRRAAGPEGANGAARAAEWIAARYFAQR